jgi:hypothetical protein
MQLRLKLELENIRDELRHIGGRLRLGIGAQVDIRNHFRNEFDPPKILNKGWKFGGSLCTVKGLVTHHVKTEDKFSTKYSKVK